MATVAQENMTLWEQIEALREEAAEHESVAQEKMREADEEWQKRQGVISRMSDLLKEAAETGSAPSPAANSVPAPTQGNGGKPAPKKIGGKPASAPAPKKIGGKPASAPAPKKIGGKPASAPAPKKIGGKPASAPAPKKIGGKPAAIAAPARKDKVEPHERNYGQETSCRKEIWNILERSPDTYKKYIPDYPDGAVGLKISELKEIIEQEGKWVSSSSNISPQIQGHLHELKKAGKLYRNEDDRRYYIVDGAELDGPDLDDKWRPLTK